MADEVDAWIGRELDGRYRIVERLGEGGMGAVYVAEHRTLRKQVAVKTIRPEYASNRQAEARFAREALATGKLDHPHVVSAIDYGQLPDGGAYLVTQLVRGESLARRMGRGPLTIAEVCVLGAQVADALVAAHAAGIVHRDLKPDNILLETRDDGSLHAKVVDFGVARMTEADAGGEAALPITRMGAVIGTPGYMAPEQATGGNVDARVDLYALGVILWECCAGQPLWDTGSMSQLAIAQLTRTPPGLYPELAPRELAGLIETLLARAPEQRPAHALAVREALRKLGREVRGDWAATPTAKVRAVAPPTGPNADGAPTVKARANADGSPALTARAVAPPTGPNADGAPTTSDRPRGRAGLWLGAAAIVAIVVAVAASRGEEAKPEVVEAAKVAEETKVAEVRTPAEKRALASRRELLKELPEAFVEHGRALLLSTSRDERAQAGRAVMAASGADRVEIPAYFMQIAAFETAEDCEGRRAILREIAAADDVRSTWALRSWQEQPKNECRGRDCLACLRSELGRMVGAFEATIAE